MAVNLQEKLILRFGKLLEYICSENCLGEMPKDYKDSGKSFVMNRRESINFVVAILHHG